MRQRGMRYFVGKDRKKETNLEYEDVDGRMILKWILEGYGGIVRTELISGGLLGSFRCHNFGEFHK
jgi:hypothetical protein